MMRKTWGSRWALICTLALTVVGMLTYGAAPAQAQDADRKVTLNLKDVPLRNAIDALFTGTGLQYAVDPNVPNVPVNLNIRDVGLQAALRILIRQAAVAVPGLTSAREGDIFIVKIRPPAPMNTQPTAEEAPPEFGDEATEVTWEKIPIQFNNAAVFVLAFGGQMLPSESDVLMGGGMGMMGGMGGMGGGMMGGMGGGMMGGMGGMGMMGGMGGMGGFGGMGGGMMGGMGGMMGGMGGMGGMMGGMGGFGGGMGGFGGGMGGFGGGGLGGFGGGGFGGRF